MGNGKARAFGTAWAPGMGTKGMIDAQFAASKEGEATGRVAKGVLGMPETTRDPSFYSKKRAVEAELGRELSLEEFRDHYWQEPDASTSSGTSIFDPVICEIAYRWFCPPGGVVLDPFAGGSVRGIVASRLGREYVGVELREEQVAANEEQAARIGGDPAPRWITGDSRKVKSLAKGVKADLVFSCPPYWNLEVYSDDPNDLSNLGKGEFLAAHAAIIRDSVAKLRDDRFAVWVIGDVRDADGFYINLPGHTVEAFEAAGARYYNESILVTAVGSLPIRAGRQFERTRKLGKTHQNVLVFCKGDPRKATEAVGEVEFGEIEPEPDAAEALPDQADTGAE